MLPENEQTNDTEFSPESLTVKGPESMEPADPRATGGCCGRGGADVGILWNDAGHRTQIERAIWLLAAAEPAGPFLSLWSMKPFRDGFYEGIWAADYLPHYNNPGKVPFYEGPFWTSHFWNPERGTHYGQDHAEMRAFGAAGKIARFDENALTAALQNLKLATIQHDNWKAGWRDAGTARFMGMHLGAGMHFVTDLTQPMHTANFTNGWGFAESVVVIPNFGDQRHPLCQHD
jgi:hypothetical protein